jgi:hypothetical protein
VRTRGDWFFELKLLRGGDLRQMDTLLIQTVENITKRGSGFVQSLESQPLSGLVLSDRIRLGRPCVIGGIFREVRVFSPNEPAIARSRRQFFENAALGFRRKQKTDDTPKREDNRECHEHVADAVVRDDPSNQEGSD